MEPVGAWFTSYNRFTNQQTVQPGTDLHNGGPQPPATSQLFLTTPHHPGTNLSAAASPFPGPSGFLSPQPVTYDPVFNPLFHQKGHYRAFKQPTDAETYNYISNSGNNYFEQSNSTPLTWAQNNQLHSPFGVLPHESVIQSTSVTKPFDNLGHFAPQSMNHFNAQNDYKDYDSRKFSSPVKPNAQIFCQTVNDYQRFQNHLQQGFSSVQDSTSRFPQSSFRGNQFLQKSDSSCECATRYVRPLVHPEPKVGACGQVQSSPISYAMFDNHRNYPGNKEPQPFHLNHLNYNRFSSSEDCVQRGRNLKGLVETYSGRPSPVASPTYPLYYHNSPVTASSSNSTPSPVDPPQPPQDDPQLVFQQATRAPLPLEKLPDDSPLNVILPRPMAYPPAVPRSELNKNYNLSRGEDDAWETRDKRNLPPCAESQMPLHLQRLKSCRGDPMSLVKTLQQQQQNQQTPIRSANFEADKNHIGADFFSRVPPPAHHNTFNQQVQNGYFDFDRWNSAKMFSAPPSFAAQNSHSGKFSLHASATPHLQPQPTNYGPLPAYLPVLTAPSPVPDADIGTNTGNTAALNSQGHQDPEELLVPDSNPDSSSDRPAESNPAPPKRTLDRRVPTIEEELGLLEDAEMASQPNGNVVQKARVGFMKEYLKFVHSDRRESPKPAKHQLENDSSCTSVKIMKPASSNGELHIKNATADKVGTASTMVGKCTPDAPVKTRSNFVNQTEDSEKFPFTVDDFVVMKSDLHLLHPPIWKVKKNLLLQKFTHFVSRGVAFYSNVPVFTGWSPACKKVFQKVHIRTVKQRKNDVIVKLIPINMLASPDGSSLTEKLVSENKKYREAFEIYVQALFSQALDSKFLREIHQEKDDYFLSHIRTVEGFWSELVASLKDALVWSRDDVEVLSGSPNYRYSPAVASQDNCLCSKPAASCATLGGLPYSFETLELSETPIPQKIVPLCSTCKDNFELLHKLTHQKYLLFSVCDDVVTTKKVECLNNDASIVLCDLLKDDNWFDKVFDEFLRLWAHAGKVTRDLSRLKSANDDRSAT